MNLQCLKHTALLTVNAANALAQTVEVPGLRNGTYQTGSAVWCVLPTRRVNLGMPGAADL